MIVENGRRRVYRGRLLVAAPWSLRRCPVCPLEVRAGFDNDTKVLKHSKFLILISQCVAAWRRPDRPWRRAPIPAAHFSFGSHCRCR